MDLLGKMGIVENPAMIMKDVDTQSGRQYVRIETRGGVEVGLDAVTGEPISAWFPPERQSAAPSGGTSNREVAVDLILERLRSWGYKTPEGAADRVEDSGDVWSFIWNRRIDGYIVFPDVTVLTLYKKSGVLRTYKGAYTSAEPVSKDVKLEAADAARVASGIVGPEGLSVVETATPELLYVATEESSRDPALATGTYLCWGVVVRGAEPVDGKVFVSAADGKVVAKYTR